MSGTREALLVAASEYDDPELTGLRWPAADVTALAEVLGDASIGAFEVHEPLVNQSSDAVRRRIDEFLSSAGKEDFRLLYFSCHGVLSPGRRLFFAMPNTRTKTSLRSTAVEDTFVHEALTESKAKTKVLILDCCHSGAFARGLATKGGDEAKIDVGRFAGGGVVTLTASKEIEYAYEDGHLTELEGAALGGSIFTRLMVEGLRTGAADVNDDGTISVDELYQWTEARMHEVTQRQQPGCSTNLHGSIAIGFTRRSRVPDALLSALRDMTSVYGRLHAIHGLRTLAQGAEPELAAEIRTLLEQRLADEDPNVAASAEAVLAGRAPPAPGAAPRAAAAAPSDKAREWIRSADREWSAGRFKSALERYDRALKASPTATDARVGRAHALIGLQRHDEALDALDAAIQDDPEHIWGRVSRAGLLIALDRPAAAKLDVDAALAVEPDSVDALTARARVLAAQGRAAEAAGAFQQVLDAAPDQVEALVGLADALADAGVPAEAHAAADRAIAVGGTSDEARLAKARLYYDAGDVERGDEQVAHVLERDPGDARARLLRGRAHLEAGPPDDALADFDRALESVPDLPGALFGRATVLRHSRPREALKAVGRIADAPRVRGLWQPGPAEVSTLKAGVLLELGRHAKALAAADAALAEAPDAPAARLLRARANLGLDRPELALGDLDVAASGGEDVGELRSIAVGALMQRPRELWPEDVGEDEVARALYGDSLLAATIPGVELDAMALARKLGPQERPLWLTACRYRQEMLRRVVLLLTSEQLVWTGPRTQGELAWSEAREVRALPPKGMRIVLHSGRRLEFPGIADEGTALTEESEPLDADGVRRLAETLTREAAPG